MVEDRLSEAVLRSGIKTFERVYEAKATIRNTAIIDDVIKAVNAIPAKRAAEKAEDKYRVVPEIKAVEQAGDTVRVYATESVKYEVEKIIKELLGEKKKGESGKRAKATDEFKVAENAYVSEVVVDVKDGEITIESRDNFSLPNVAVSASAG